MIILTLFLAVVFGIISLYTFCLAIKIMLMSEEEYQQRRNEIAASWIAYADGTVMVKRHGVGIKRKLKPKENNIKINKLDF